jgi:hypothetical protein
MSHRFHPARVAALAGLAGLIAGCGTKTDVSLTGNTPTRYSHVWVTVQEVRFNTDATAGPDDGGWSKFSFSTPSTVDLVAQNGGNLGSMASGLRVPVGTYSQVRLIPLDASAPLAASAQNAGALYNFEADYVDSQGITQQLPLELLNPDKGIGIQTSLKVAVGNIGLGKGTSTTGTALPFGSTTTSPTSTTSNPFGSTTGTSTGTTSSLTSTSGAGTTNTTPSNSFAVAFDGHTGLVPFTFAGGRAGILLSSHAAAAYDLSETGGISGQLILNYITSSTGGVPDIRVSAETLSADGTRHIVASATTVQSDGTFLLYPLATNSSTTSPITYDVVIHGPGIATIIVKAVQVPRPSSSTSTTTPTTTSSTTRNPATPYSAMTTPTTTGTSGTTTSTSATPTTTNTNASTVSIGTLTPRSATAYTANVATAPGALLPAGAVVGFYQTLGAKGEVPYVIESSPIDPFNQVLFNAQGLSSGTVDSGTWSTNGTVTIVSAAPAEGAGTYLVAASAFGFSDGTLSRNVSVSAPQSGTANVVVPAVTLAPGASAGTLAATVIAAVPGQFDQGELLLSHDGTLVATASLDAVLAQGTGGIVTVRGLPSGTPDAVYYATVRAWKGSGSVQRQWYPQAIDLRTATSAAIGLTVN